MIFYMLTIPVFIPRFRFVPNFIFRISGHTHGGSMLCIKWLISNYNGGWVGGLYNVNGMKLYVSPGTGLWAGFSCRLGVPSEITRIVRRARETEIASKQ